MESMNQVIHVKIIHNDQIRRFMFNGTEFSSLKTTIAQLLGLTDEFVLKYQDDESDYVTLDSQEDLATALMISPKILRISVDKKSAPSNCDHRMRGQPNHHQQGGHHGGHHGGQHGGHHGGHHGGRGGNPEWKKMRIEKKLAWVNQCLQDLGTDDSKLPPRDLWKKQRLLKKQQKLESCLRETNNPTVRKVLSPEEQQVNYSIKLQVMEHKAEMAKVKARQRELKIVIQSKPGDKAILDELSALKERRGLLKAQKKSLWEKFHT